MKNTKVVIWILIIIVVAGLGAYIFHSNNKNVSTTSPENPPTTSDSPVTYNNTDYGFTFSLPADWKGYSIVQSTWTGYPITGYPANEAPAEPSGVKLLLRNPNWTQEKHYEDIPIMIFTIQEWNSYQADDFTISAAPILAQELARNNKYVFALPPRWDYDFSQGYQEAENILSTKPLHPFDLPVSVNGKCGLMVTSVAPNAQVSFPVTISGSINNSNSKTIGCSWQMFEGQAGSAQLFYSDRNTWHQLGVSAPIKVADWTAEKTSFTASLDFNNEKPGLPSGTQLKVMFTEENASGMPPVDTYDLPIMLK
jgi:hypothetical protein